MSGVHHAATGPAERPAHTAQSQLHTAADLKEWWGEGGWGRETQKQMNVSPVWRFAFRSFPAAREQKHGGGGGGGEGGSRTADAAAGGESREKAREAFVVLMLLLCVWRSALAHLAAGSPNPPPPPLRSAQLHVDAFPKRSHAEARGEQSERRGPAAAWKPFWPVCC